MDIDELFREVEWNNALERMNAVESIRIMGQNATFI